MADGESRNSSGSARPNAHPIAIGVDLYNQTTTGGVAKTLSNRATDADHVPCVIVYSIDQGGASRCAWS